MVYKGIDRLQSHPMMEREPDHLYLFKLFRMSDSVYLLVFDL